MSTDTIDTIQLELDGRSFEFTFPKALGLRPFVEAVLNGADYPIVYPGLFEAKTIVDIGAHAGAASVYLKASYPGAQVYSFEPCANSYEHLVSNTAWLGGVHTFHQGLGDHTGEARLYSGVYSSMQHSMKPNGENTDDFERVSIRHAREAIEELELPCISILKVDTEGCEIEILNALSDLLPGVQVIYLEYHSEADRLELDRMLEQDFVLFAARAEEPHRGTNTYVNRALVDEVAPKLEAQYVYPKA